MNCDLCGALLGADGVCTDPTCESHQLDGAPAPGELCKSCGHRFRNWPSDFCLICIQEGADRG